MLGRFSDTPSRPNICVLRYDGRNNPYVGFTGAILPAYAELFSTLKAAGAEWVQIDEPILALDLTEGKRSAVRRASRLRWSAYAVSLIKRPMKGMLTGTSDHPAVELRACRSATF